MKDSAISHDFDSSKNDALGTDVDNDFHRNSTYQLFQREYAESSDKLRNLEKSSHKSVTISVQDECSEELRYSTIDYRAKVNRDVPYYNGDVYCELTTEKNFATRSAHGPIGIPLINPRPSTDVVGDLSSHGGWKNDNYESSSTSLREHEMQTDSDAKRLILLSDSINFPNQVGRCLNNGKHASGLSSTQSHDEMMAIKQQEKQMRESITTTTRRCSMKPSPLETGNRLDRGKIDNQASREEDSNQLMTVKKRERKFKQFSNQGNIDSGSVLNPITPKSTGLNIGSSVHDGDRSNASSHNEMIATKRKEKDARQGALKVLSRRDRIAASALLKKISDKNMNDSKHDGSVASMILTKSKEREMLRRGTIVARSGRSASTLSSNDSTCDVSIHSTFSRDELGRKPPGKALQKGRHDGSIASSNHEDMIMAKSREREVLRRGTVVARSGLGASTSSSNDGLSDTSIHSTFSRDDSLARKPLGKVLQKGDAEAEVSSLSRMNAMYSNAASRQHLQHNQPGKLSSGDEDYDEQVAKIRNDVAVSSTNYSTKPVRLDEMIEIKRREREFKRLSAAVVQRSTTNTTKQIKRNDRTLKREKLEPVQAVNNQTTNAALDMKINAKIQAQGHQLPASTTQHPLSVQATNFSVGLSQHNRSGGIGNVTSISSVGECAVSRSPNQDHRWKEELSDDLTKAILSQRETCLYSMQQKPASNEANISALKLLDHEAEIDGDVNERDALFSAREAKQFPSKNSEFMKNNSESAKSIVKTQVKPSFRPIFSTSWSAEQPGDIKSNAVSVQVPEDERDHCLLELSSANLKTVSAATQEVGYVSTRTDERVDTARHESYFDEEVGVIEAQAGVPILFPGAYAIQGVGNNDDSSGSECSSETDDFSTYSNENNIFQNGEEEEDVPPIQRDDVEVTLVAELHEEIVVDAKVISPHDDDELVLDLKTIRRVRFTQLVALCVFLGAIGIVCTSIAGGFPKSSRVVIELKPTIKGWLQVGPNLLGKNDSSQTLFGSNVVISGNGKRIAVFAPGSKQDIVLNIGGIYVMEEQPGSNSIEWKVLYSDLGTNPSRTPTSSMAASDDVRKFAIGFPTLELEGHVQIHEEADGGENWSSSTINIPPNLNYTYQGTWFGYATSMSPDGSIVAVGAPLFGKLNTSRLGAVFVFSKNIGGWDLVGAPLYGKSSNECFGWSVQVVTTEGKIRLAVGAPLAGDSTGLLRVYEWNLQQWVEMGDAIVGSDDLERFGESVSISKDGNVLAVGGRGAGFSAGVVKTYQVVNGEWLPMLGNEGSNVIYGNEPGESFGASVSLSSEGSMLAVGAPQSSSYGDDAGIIRVYHRDESTNSWIEKGEYIGSDLVQELGSSIAISSDGARVVGGAPSTPYDESIPRVGCVQVYALEKTAGTLRRLRHFSTEY